MAPLRSILKSAPGQSRRLHGDLGRQRQQCRIAKLFANADCSGHLRGDGRGFDVATNELHLVLRELERRPLGAIFVARIVLRRIVLRRIALRLLAGLGQSLVEVLQRLFESTFKSCRMLLGKHEFFTCRRNVGTHSLELAKGHCGKDRGDDRGQAETCNEDSANRWAPLLHVLIRLHGGAWQTRTRTHVEYGRDLRRILHGSTHSIHPRCRSRHRSVADELPQPSRHAFA